MYGEWWIEDRQGLEGESHEPPTHRVAGNLDATSCDNWTFETIGSVDGRSLHSHLFAADAGGLDRPAHIWGINAEGKAFSLLNSYPWQTTVRFGGFGEGTQVWLVGAIVEASNAWVTPDTEIDGFSVDFRDLGEWAWGQPDSGISWKEGDDGIVLTIRLVPRVTEATVHDSPVELSCHRTAPLTSGSFSVDIGAHFTINDRLKLSDIAEQWVYPLGRMLSLFTLAEARITSINARIADRELNGRRQYISVRLPQRIRDSEEDHTNRHPLKRQRDMMATLADLTQQGVDLGALLQAHFETEAHPKLRDTLTHFLDSQNKDDNGPDDALRCLFNAIENYHSARFDGKIPDEPGLTSEIDQIVRKTSRNNRNEIAARLKSRRHKSMKAKLAEIVDSCGEATQRVLYYHPRLVDDAYQVRNELAHTNPTTSNQWRRQQVLRSLQWLMRHTLLRELGLTTNQADAIFQLTGRPFSRYARPVED